MGGVISMVLSYIMWKEHQTIREEIIFEKNFNYKFYLIELIIHNENQRIIKIKMINNY